MATPPDDLEQKVDLLLENLNLKERELVYQQENERLKIRGDELEERLEKYEPQKKIKIGKIASVLSTAALLLLGTMGGILSWRYHSSEQITRQQEKYITQKLPRAIIKAINQREHLNSYFICVDGEIVDRYSPSSFPVPFENVIGCCMTNLYLNIVRSDSLSFLDILRNTKERQYKVGLDAYYSDIGPQANYNGSDCSFTIDGQFYKNWPSGFATVECNDLNCKFIMPSTVCHDVFSYFSSPDLAACSAKRDVE